MAFSLTASGNKNCATLNMQRNELRSRKLKFSVGCRSFRQRVASPTIVSQTSSQFANNRFANGSSQFANLQKSVRKRLERLEDDLRSGIFGTLVLKFIACLIMYLLMQRCNYLVRCRRRQLDLVLQRLGFTFRCVVMGMLPWLECSVSFCY